MGALNNANHWIRKIIRKWTKTYRDSGLHYREKESDDITKLGCRDNPCRLSSMKKLLKYIFIALLALGIGTTGAHALSTLLPQQGGTGIGTATSGDVGKVLTVSNNAPFTYTLSSPTGGGYWSRDAVNGRLYPSTLTDKVGLGSTLVGETFSERLLVLNTSGALANTIFATNDFVGGSTGTVFRVGFGSATGNSNAVFDTFTNGGNSLGNLVFNPLGGNIGAFGTDNVFQNNKAFFVGSGNQDTTTTTPFDSRNVGFGSGHIFNDSIDCFTSGTGNEFDGAVQSQIFGAYNILSGQGSFVAGFGNTVAGSSGVALGGSVYIYAENAVAIGSQSSVYGFNGTAISGGTANGAFSLAMLSNGIANGNYSIAIDGTATKDYEVSIKDKIYIDGDTSNVGINTNSAVSLFTIHAGDIEVEDLGGTAGTSGLILTSPNGTRYRIKVSDLGILSTVAI